MKRELVLTSDGSTSLHIPDLKEGYHSTHGAIQEALHVYLKNGFHELYSKDTVDILEMGFGTGLNVLLTYAASNNSSQHVNYTSLEAYPITLEEASKMNFVSKIDVPESIYLAMHQSDWGVPINLSDTFELTKLNTKLEDFKSEKQYDLIYYDAFGFHAQPHLWDESCFKKMYCSLKMGGILVTYCCKGSVKRALNSVGFKTEKLPGPPGKREMLRAIKMGPEFDIVTS